MADSQDDIAVFDRRQLMRRRARAVPRFRDHAFLVEAVAEGLIERLEDINRRFELAVDLGSHDGTLTRHLMQAGIDTVLRTDLAAAFLHRGPGLRLVADEEALPFAEASVDLIASDLSLHWVNDLPGVLVQIRRALKPDGLFLAAMFGGRTLSELRTALTDAELEVAGGVSPRVAPFTDVRDAGDLLQRAGFAMPVADSETLTATYDDLFSLMGELRGMGETNIVRDRDRRPPSRHVFLRAAEIYAERFADGEGRVPATFEIIYLTGWAPHPDQPQPKRPGSATARLSEALATKEHQVPGTKPGGGSSHQQ